MMNDERTYDDAYDRFAQLYNDHWGGHSVRFLLPLYEKHVLLQIAAGSNVADLCCGTGQFSEALCERGFNVVGLDSSAEMLSYARRNALAATFLADDVRDFQLPQPVAAAVSVYDSLNHLLSRGDLVKAFSSVCGNLQPGGLFAFDMNLEEAYRTRWNSSFEIDDEVWSCHVRSRRNLSKRQASLTAIIRRKADSTSETRVTLHQTWYTPRTIESSLKGAGFAGVEQYVIGAKAERPGRMLFVARKAV